MSNCISTDPRPVPIELLTSVELDGTGVFDKLLSLMRLHLDREFNQGRIQGKEYSDVFVKSYTATLDESIKYLLAEQKFQYEKCILEEQYKEAKFNNEFILPKELELKDAQMRKMDADARIAEKELELREAMFPLTVGLAEKEIEKLTADTAIALKKLELDEAMLPLTIQLTEAQVKKMEADSLLAEKQLELADKELLLKEKELELAELQRELNQWKVETEKAQTMDSAEPGSAIDWGNKVMEAQYDGFYNDAKQKATDTLLRTWVTRMNNDKAWVNNANMLTDKYIGRAVANMFEGLNIDISLRDEDDEIFTPPDI